MNNQARQEITSQVESYLLKKYRFKYNNVANRVEFRKKKPKTASKEILIDYNANSMRRELRYAGLSIGKSDFHSLLNSDFIPTHNPFETYFYNLPQWNYGDTDYITEMALKVKTTNDELWERCFRKWIIGVVACALEDKVINQTAIVFTGRQGIGKTTFLKGLVPDLLKDYYYEGTINPNNKDSLTNLAECFLINLDELENLSKHSAGGLKEIITKTSVRMRRPYGTIQENFPRRASFCGSVNHKEFLRDTTGNRRFLCFEALSFDNAKPVDLGGVYSQALFLWREGFPFWFDSNEIAEINEHDRQYQLISAEEDALLEYYEPGKDDDKRTQRLTTTEVHRFIELFCKLPPTDASISQLGKALHAHNFERMKSGGRQLWLVRPKVDLHGNKVV